MKIYHGTSETIARLAVNEGLKPRALTGNSNWKSTVESNEYAVYLTTAYAGYFAMATGSERLGIVEIETDLLEQCLLVPDEDFLEQASRGQKVEGLRAKTMEGRTRWFRKNLLRFGHLWQPSVNGLGNCAYLSPIPPEAITRIAVIDAKHPLLMYHVDPMIMLLNYMIMGPKYRAISQWLIGDTVTPQEVLMEPPPAPEFPDIMRQRWEQTERMLANRTGWELIHVAHDQKILQETDRDMPDLPKQSQEV